MSSGNSAGLGQLRLAEWVLQSAQAGSQRQLHTGNFSGSLIVFHMKRTIVTSLCARAGEPGSQTPSAASWLGVLFLCCLCYRKRTHESSHGCPQDRLVRVIDVVQVDVRASDADCSLQSTRCQGCSWESTVDMEGNVEKSDLAKQSSDASSRVEH